MPTKSAKTSDEGSEPPEGSSVYDFLYYDARRIASFLAQLGQYGAPGKVTHRQRSGGALRDSTSKKGTLGVPGALSGEATLNAEHSTDHDEALEQEYDPLWINGLSLYDDLSTRGLIKTDLASARIGDFIDVNGAISVVDFSMFRILWQRPSIQGLIQAGIDQNTQPPAITHGNRRERRRSERLPQRTQAEAMAQATTGNLIGDILAALPHPVQARFMTEARQSVWSSLKADSVLVEPADIFLKHGIALDGRWRMFGVLDALPTSSTPDALKAAVTEDFGSSPLGLMALGMLPLLQAGFARPDEAWGLTPIMIFRELTAR